MEHRGLWMLDPRSQASGNLARRRSPWTESVVTRVFQYNWFRFGLQLRCVEGRAFYQGLADPKQEIDDFSICSCARKYEVSLGE